MSAMTPTRVEGLLARLVIDAIDEHDHECDVVAFTDAGIMTADRGLIMRFPDGTEFQVTIVQSGYADADDEEGQL